MLWSFPALLDTDPAMARDALEYALTTQMRNTGLHSRFIDSIVLEDGLQLDEAAAPVIALASFVTRSDDTCFVAAHQATVARLGDGLLRRIDPATRPLFLLAGLSGRISKTSFHYLDNVLVWRALSDLRLHRISPGSLLKLPSPGFIAESDPTFMRTNLWLQSKNYAYSYADQPLGLPGSYCCRSQVPEASPITCSWPQAARRRSRSSAQAPGTVASSQKALNRVGKDGSGWPSLRYRRGIRRPRHLPALLSDAAK
jgi:hypothetical protein